ncbi:hypothetical protein MNBD_NITROSPINAE01-651 [hydrothermal vent metagenome]|uniref:Uncharacterized protein n=1 Tax=hydrothermal vent metagenome TaxID=652676 RepID=A0A3B1BPY8_9ZZZZ
MKVVFTAFVMFSMVCFSGCSDDSTKTDLPQELAAKKMLDEISILVKQNRLPEANEVAVTLEKEFGHTKIYTGARVGLMQKGVYGKDYKNAITGQAIIELENRVLSFFKDIGRWPRQSEIKAIVDAWGRALYWVAGDETKNYDMLFISSGPDGIRGTGDELIIVWSEQDLGGYKDKVTGKMVGQTRKTKKRKMTAGGTPAVITLDELAKQELSAGVPKDSVTTLDALRKKEDANDSRGDGEVVMSLGEIKEKL